MKPIKVLLVSILPGSHRNMSIMSLFACLKHAGIDTKVLFLPRRNEYRGDLLQEFVRQQGFSLVGISVMSEGFKFARRITEDIKAVSPQTTVVWGGIHPSLRPEECLPFTDCVCIGEGEKTLLSLVERLAESKSYADLPGIGTVPAGGKALINPPSPLVSDLDSLPYVTYDWPNLYVQDSGGLGPFDHAKYRAYSNYNGEDYTLMASRGCPFNCSYCSNSSIRALYGKNFHVRKRSVDSVIQECKAAVAGIGTIKFINFMDEQFLLSHDWIKEFSERYRKEVNLPFIVQIHPASLNEEMICLLKDAGLKFAILGIQSGSQKTNDDIFHRKFNAQTLIDASKVLSRNGVFAYYDIIIENEFEDEQDRDDTVQLLLKLKKPFSLTFYALTGFPGTDIEAMYREKGIAPRIDPYDHGYREVNQDDFHFQICSIIPITPQWMVKNIFYRGKKNAFFRYLLKVYFQQTKKRRGQVKTAQKKK